MGAIDPPMTDKLKRGLLKIHCKSIYTLFVILANLTNQMRVNLKVHTHFQGMRVLV